MESLIPNSCNLIPNKRANCNIDMKNILFLMTLIVGLITIISQTALAQNTQNNTQTPLNQTGIITNLLEQRDILFVTVLSETPITLILQGEFGEVPAQRLDLAIDIAKQNGYSIDAVTVFTEESVPSLGTITLTPIYTIFMSKQ